MLGEYHVVRLNVWISGELPLTPSPLPLSLPLCRWTGKAGLYYAGHFLMMYLQLSGPKSSPILSFLKHPCTRPTNA